MFLIVVQVHHRTNEKDSHEDHLYFTMSPPHVCHMDRVEWAFIPLACVNHYQRQDSVLTVRAQEGGFVSFLLSFPCICIH